jgi:YVTN family beta-propeller protein
MRARWLLLVAGMAVTGCFDDVVATIEDAAAKPKDAAATSDSPTEDVVDDAPRADVAAADGGGDGGVAPADVPRPLRARATPTEGGAVVVSGDDAVVVAANRIAGSVAVFGVAWGADGPTPTRRALLAFNDGEPWAAVIGNDDDTAYVVLRRAQEVVEITGLRSAPQIGRRARVGSEPTGVAISPTGRRLYVANMADGTVSEVDTATMEVLRAVDLNLGLAPRLGPAAAARPGVAHPRAIAVSNDGDLSDADETVYVTEFFGQPRRGGVPDGVVGIDVAREGVVYRFNAGSGVAAEPIGLAPVEDTGFVDSEGLATGCFPSQLHAVALRGARLYVPAVCASPRGPVGPSMDSRADANFRTQIHSVLYAVDLAAGAEVPRERALLTRELDAFYTRAMAADDGARRMPLIPSAVAFAPTGSTALVAAYGADALFRLRYRGDGALDEVATEGAAAFVDLRATDGGGGALPVGVAWAVRGTHAFALGAGSRLLSVVNVNGMNVARTAPAADPPSDGLQTSIARGRRLFATGLGRWSLRGQAWNSCEACHPDGLTDNVTWYFPRGPRQTISLDGTYDANGAQRVLNWTAMFDEVHDFELNVRNNSGGVGAIVHREGDGATPPRVTVGDRIVFDGTTGTAPQVPTASSHAGLDGSTRLLMPEFLANVRSAIDDWKQIDLYVRSLRAPRAPSNLRAEDIAAGRALFERASCQGCHGGAGWTLSRRWYTPGMSTTDPTAGSLRTTSYTLPMDFPSALNPPANNGMRQAFLRLTGDPGVLAANDQILCVLRAVGTFPTSLDDARTGVAPAGVLVREVRADMRTAAQGASGFNPPSLLGVGFGAPYLHAGNARTLEEVFAPTFNAHARAFSAQFLADPKARAEQVRQLVAFLLSLDDGAAPVTTPSTLPYETDLCPRM